LLNEGSMSTRLLLVGHGRMGRLVESLAHDAGFDVVGAVDSKSPASAWLDAEVAIDFSVASAVPETSPAGRREDPGGQSARPGGRTWKPGVRAAAAKAGLGVVAAPNFAIGVNIFLATSGTDRLADCATTRVSALGSTKLHHAAKRDAPSGTALALESRVRRGGYGRPVPDLPPPGRDPYRGRTRSGSMRHPRRSPSRMPRATRAARSLAARCSPRAG
jgi:4-hydroxy-tetrahydrodipicolinate reductase